MCCRCRSKGGSFEGRYQFAHASGLVTDLWPYVERIETPTLLLKGEQSDLVTPETWERMEETMPDLEVVEVKNTGHMIPQDVPEEFERLVRSFLEKVY